MKGKTEPRNPAPHSVNKKKQWGGRILVPDVSVHRHFAVGTSARKVTRFFLAYIELFIAQCGFNVSVLCVDDAASKLQINSEATSARYLIPEKV